MFIRKFRRRPRFIIAEINALKGLKGKKEKKRTENTQPKITGTKNEKEKKLKRKVGSDLWEVCPGLYYCPNDRCGAKHKQARYLTLTSANIGPNVFALFVMGF